MSEIVQACLLCGRPENTLFDEREFRGHIVTNRLCSNCGLVFQSPRMTEAELNKFYETEYRNLYQGDEGPTQKDLAAQQGRARTLLSMLQETVPSVKRHLDIGSSAGELLTQFQSSYDSESIGVEPGDSYRKFAQKKGLKVHSSLDELKKDYNVPFDLITLAHVLEHLPDPIAYLRDLRANFLSPDGWLLLEVPNLFAHDSFEVAHTTAFSPHTLREVVQQAGFDVVLLKKHGAPRSNILPLYITLLAHPASNDQPIPLRLERMVSLKRRLGMLRRGILSRLLPQQAWLPNL